MQTLHGSLIRKEWLMAKIRLFLAGIAFVASTFLCQTAWGEDVVVDASASRLWSTVTNASVVLPVPWPQGAATATLVVPASGLFVGVEAALTKGVDSSYTLFLPRPSAPNEEYIVSPTVEFANADGEALTPRLAASFAVVCDVSLFRGTDTDATAWTDVKKGTYALPKPDDETLLLTGFGGGVATNALTDRCAWMTLSPKKSGPYSLSLYGADGELSFSAFLNAMATGFIFSVK